MTDLNKLRIVPKGSTKSYTFIDYLDMRVDEAVEKKLKDVKSHKCSCGGKCSKSK